MSRTNVHSVTFTLLAIAFFTVCLAMFLANSGCSSGDICYRNTDCPIGGHCTNGSCMHRLVISNDGTSGGGGASSSVDAGTMTGALESQSGAGSSSSSDAGSGGS